MVNMYLVFMCSIITLGLSAFESTCLDNKRIIGGLETFEEKRFPGDISLRAITANGSVHLCGGVLVRPLWVLSAAHCTVGRMAFNLEILIAKKEKRDIEKIIKNNYDDHTGQNDIALLRILETKTIDTAYLPSSEYQPAGYCTVFGYGITDISSLTLPTTLHKAVVQVISRQQCRQAIGRYQVLASDVVCAGGGASDACLGDSGSPLFCHRGDGSQVLAGIVSSGFNGCATAGVPGVYTSVAAHRDWIDWALSSVLLLSKT